MTFGLLAPMAQLNRAIRLVAVSSLLGNVINDSLPRLDFKTNLGGLQLALSSKDLFNVQTSTISPEVTRITHEIEDRLDQIQDSVRKHGKLLLEDKASKRTDLPQLIQLQLVQPPTPTNHVQFSSGQLHVQHQTHPQVQQLQLQPLQSVPQQQQPIVMRLLALNTAGNGQLNQNPSSSAILLFQNGNHQQQFNGHFALSSHQQLPTGVQNQLAQQVAPTQAQAQSQPQTISIENLTAALTHASFASPSVATGVISGQIEPRTKEAEEEQKKDVDEIEDESDEPTDDEKKKKKAKKQKKT